MTQYLNTHPQRASFTLGVHGRSKQKVTELRKELQLDDTVKSFYADVLNGREVEEVVRQAKVIINTVGPFWRWGTLVVKFVASVFLLCDASYLTSRKSAGPARRMRGITSTSLEKPTGCGKSSSSMSFTSS